MAKNAALRNLAVRCPACGARSDDWGDDRLSCRHCGHIIEIHAGALVVSGLPMDAMHDPLDRIKARLKRFPRLYEGLIEVISPVFPAHRIRIRRYLRQTRETRPIAINVGSGNTSIDDRVINVDIFNYAHVDVVAGAYDLPICDDSVDIAVSLSVVEHLRQPHLALAEMRRVLRPGGTLLIYVPFMSGFHASPDDFQRYSIEGMRQYLDSFEIDEIVASGPTSALLWIFQEWAATLLSFGIRPLARLLNIVFMLLTFPLKFLDSFMRFMPGADHVSAGFLAICRKPDEP